ncbi:MAG TPA: hypothetical protein VF077_13195 [Nitrospiraceae bacterium]
MTPKIAAAHAAFECFMAAAPDELREYVATDERIRMVMHVAFFAGCEHGADACQRIIEELKP